MSNILEWLNENEFRAYPLRDVPNKEIVLRSLNMGVPEIPVRNSSTYGGYHFIESHTDDTISCLDQISVGDEIEWKGTRGVVNRVIARSMYTSVDLSLGGTVKYPDYFDIIKSSKSQIADINFDALILDANLVYTTAQTSVALTAIEIDSTHPTRLIITITGQTFNVPNYAFITANTYIRNTYGSLIVVGPEIAKIKYNIYPVNQYFEPSVCHILNEPWQGVTSLTFNSTALTGDIVFTEGYHTSITPTTAGFLIKAGRNYGLPVECGKIYSEIVAPSDCAAVVSTINGMPSTASGDFKLIAGEGVAIFNDPDNHRIYLGINSSTSNICATPNP